ncbi:MAG: benzoate transporter [Alphaproteobacteria bacterium]|nr:benzoate transporter [Alphaproteobacteria bacterium]
MRGTFSLQALSAGVLAAFVGFASTFAAVIKGLAAVGSFVVAGVLLSLCLAPVKAVAASPIIALVIIVVWVAVGKLNRLYAVPAAVITTVVAIAATTLSTFAVLERFVPHVAIVMPTFTLQASISIALQLFLVTMASQNIPGVAVLSDNGFRLNPSPLFATTGLLTIVGAPFGASAVNLAAITAALCAGPDAHPDPGRCYCAAVVNGWAYIAIGLGAGAAAAFSAAAPSLLIEALAGLALLGSFGAAIAGATGEPKDREAAIVTFIVSASGLTFLGIGAAFWGLVAGGVVLAVPRWRSTAPRA